jgi:phosphomevalonate kinase
MKLRAPGKVFLAGEYAVLERGRPALVVGVDKFLEARVLPAEEISIQHGEAVWRSGPPPPELRFAARAVSLAKPARPFRLVYENELAVDGKKLGLGGSAAATVLAVRAARPDLNDDEALSLAVAAHFIEQGGSGSGGDVAASCLGGILRVEGRIPWASAEEALSMPIEELTRARPIDAQRLRAPPDLRLLLAFTGEPADTRVLIKRVRALSVGDRPRWRVCEAAITRACEALTNALQSSEREAALQAVREGAAAMARLGEAAQAPIVTVALAKACALAAAAGAAAKPSGAGGGDCAVVVAFGDEMRDRAEAALAPHFQTFRVSPSC